MNLDREAFKAWLESKPGNEVVGQSQDGCSCPAANYIKTQGVRFEHIDWKDFYLEEMLDGRTFYMSKRYITPPWLSEFIREVDALDPEQISVTASAALYCLAVVPA